MSWFIKRFSADTEEHKNLEQLAAALSEKSPNGWKYRVEDTYFDYGQDWWWTTVICHKSDKGGTLDAYQALWPAEQEKLLLCDGSAESIDKIADEVLHGKFCPDVKRGVA